MEKQTVPTPPPPQQPAIPQKSKPPFLLIGLAALVLILLVSTGFLAFQNYQLRKEISQLQSSPSPTPPPDPTANWETYINEEYGFSIEHPKNVSLKAEEKSDVIGTNKYLVITITSDNGQILLKAGDVKAMASQSDYKNFPTGEKLKFNYIEWTKYLTTPEKVKEQAGGIPPTGPIVEFVTERNNYVYIFAEFKTDISGLGTQILSTFKFTNGSVYSNAEYKFSFEIKNGERVVECPNKSEFSDNTAVWVSKTPQPQNPQSDCATDGPENSVFASKKAYGLSSVDDYIKSLESPGNDYQLVKVSITVSGIKGLKITGTRDPNKPAPLPSEIEKIVLSNEGILYIFDPSFLERNFSITK